MRLHNVAPQVKQKVWTLITTGRYTAGQAQIRIGSAAQQLTMHTKPWKMGTGKLANLTRCPAIIPRSLPLFHNRCYVPRRHCQLHENDPKFVNNDGGQKKTHSESQHPKLTITTQHCGGGHHASVCTDLFSRNRTYCYGNTPLPLPATITIVYKYTHTLVSCSPALSRPRWWWTA